VPRRSCGRQECRCSSPALRLPPHRHRRKPRCRCSPRADPPLDHRPCQHQSMAHFTRRNICPPRAPMTSHPGLPRCPHALSPSLTSSTGIRQRPCFDGPALAATVAHPTDGAPDHLPLPASTVERLASPTAALVIRRLAVCSLHPLAVKAPQESSACVLLCPSIGARDRRR
jgi:hypothetical protein